jgi:hypothetical protein
MNILEAHGIGKPTQDKLKQSFAQLIDDNLRFTKSKEDGPIGCTLEHTGQAKSETTHIVGECCAIKP